VDVYKVLRRRKGTPLHAAMSYEILCMKVGGTVQPVYLCKKNMMASVVPVSTCRPAPSGRTDFDETRLVE
jgi:hypothetical protein